MSERDLEEATWAAMAPLADIARSHSGDTSLRTCYPVCRLSISIWRQQGFMTENKMSPLRARMLKDKRKSPCQCVAIRRPSAQAAVCNNGRLHRALTKADLGAEQPNDRFSIMTAKIFHHVSTRANHGFWHRGFSVQRQAVGLRWFLGL